MAYPQGIDFRADPSYVTDPTNYDYVSNVAPVQNAYPFTTAQGNTVGWEGGDFIQYRDRASGNDARIAGVNFAVGSDMEFRFDLPASGNYLIGLGAGDAIYPASTVISLKDTSTSLGSLATGATSGAQRFNDATDTEYTQVTWPTSQTLVSKTFSTTICRFLVASGSAICTAYVEAAPITAKPSHYYQMLRNG